MERITQNMLDRQADLINRMLNRPAKPYVDGKAQVGNFHIDSCGFGYWSFVEMCNEHGGIKTIIGGCSKRELWERMHAWRAGLEYAMTAAEKSAARSEPRVFPEPTRFPAFNDAGKSVMVSVPEGE